LRAQGEDGRDPTRVGDPARSENRDGRDRVDDCRHERQRGDLAPDMAACLPALRDHHVDAGRDRPPRLLGAPDRVQHEPTGIVHLIHVPSRVAKRERDDP